jgi:hypothetical protein
VSSLLFVCRDVDSGGGAQAFHPGAAPRGGRHACGHRAGVAGACGGPHCRVWASRWAAPAQGRGGVRLQPGDWLCVDHPEEGHRAPVQADREAGELRGEDHGVPGEGAPEEADGRQGQGDAVGVHCGDHCGGRRQGQHLLQELQWPREDVPYQSLPQRRGYQVKEFLAVPRFG